MNKHTKFALCCLPRSGSFLASQLLEEYLVRKYDYSRIPFYEFLCFTTMKNVEGNLHATIVDDEIVCSPVDREDFDPSVEIAHRLELLERHAEIGKYYINKIIYRTSPIETMQYLVKSGHYMGFIERRDIIAQISSHALAIATRDWHDDPNKRNFDFGREKIEFPFESVEIQKDYVERHVFALKDMRDYYGWSYHSVIHYEDFKDDYSNLFLTMELDDYKDYLPDFDFIKSKPSPSYDSTKLIENYDDVAQWIEDYKKEYKIDD